MVLFSKQRQVMESKVYIAKEEEEIITENVITTISDLNFVERLNSYERNELASLLKEQYKQGFINGSQLKKEQNESNIRI
jgi:hypothetical protein